MIHIEQQTAGVINNAEGNITIHGGQQGSVVTDEAARRAAHELRGALATVTLDRGTRAAAQAQAAEIETAVQASQPDKSRVAGLLKRLTGLLAAAGSLVTASVPVIGPLRALARWLGTLGVPVLRLLPV